MQTFFTAGCLRRFNTFVIKLGVIFSLQNAFFISLEELNLKLRMRVNKAGGSGYVRFSTKVHKNHFSMVNNL